MVDLDSLASLRMSPVLTPNWLSLTPRLALNARRFAPLPASKPPAVLERHYEADGWLTISVIAIGAMGETQSFAPIWINEMVSRQKA